MNEGSGQDQSTVPSAEPSLGLPLEEEVNQPTVQSTESSRGLPPGWIIAQPARPSTFRTIFLLIVGILFGSTCATCVSMQANGEGPFGREGPRVGVVEVLGPITSSREIVENLAEFSHNESIEAVVIRIDSPGGAVGPSQEIYEAIRRLASVKPTVASMGAVAASGGFWIALGADEIFANPGTITGSIGVIVQTPNLTKIAEMLKFSTHTYKSGPHKDLGNPLRPPSEGDIAIFQRLIDDVYEQFVELTASRRNLKDSEVRPLADGRIVSGRDALRLKLVDGLGGLETAARRAIAMTRGVETSTSVVTEESPILVYPEQPVPTLLELIGVTMNEAVSTGLSDGLENGLKSLQQSPLELR